MKRYTSSSGRSSQFHFRLFVPRGPRLWGPSKGLSCRATWGCVLKQSLNHKHIKEMSLMVLVVFLTTRDVQLIPKGVSSW